VSKTPDFFLKQIFVSNLRDVYTSHPSHGGFVAFDSLQLGKVTNNRIVI